MLEKMGQPLCREIPLEKMGQVFILVILYFIPFDPLSHLSLVDFLVEVLPNKTSKCAYTVRC